MDSKSVLKRGSLLSVPDNWPPEMSALFADRSSSELLRNLAVYKACSYSWLANCTPSIIKAASAVHLGTPLYAVIRRTLFRQFCGGENSEDVKQAMESLQNKGIGVILDYAAEIDLSPLKTSAPESRDEANSYHDGVRDNIIRAITTAKSSANPFVAIKLTGLFENTTLEALAKSNTNGNGKLALSDDLVISYENGWNRLVSICEIAKESNVRLAIDAEQSFVQDAIDDIALSAMQQYNGMNNSPEPLIVNTYQLYRKDGIDRLKSHLDRSKSTGFHFGAKLVRGAYVIGERIWAEERKITCPIFDTIQETHSSYDSAIDLVLNYVQDLPDSDHRRFLFIFATHNEASIKKATELYQRDFSLLSRMQICFAQLYGMSDVNSISLAKAGYPVFKYLPYGPVKEVVPYLIRRSQENSSVFQLAKSDANLMWRELKSRFFRGGS
ncbi:Proline dehydrogenase [Paramicrosporidium saccamoebae]|uniref:Proline dehydrogenase n=1 Tax=Paramicrosporidium saccamoebae TaxID=1246581 RepID=A0A2H9TM72_9FUNG|nr:Proline dehydrogenase [Paramicrosporidium saccamoebae]